jgi:hypothetical protein
MHSLHSDVILPMSSDCTRDQVNQALQLMGEQGWCVVRWSRQRSEMVLPPSLSCCVRQRLTLRRAVCRERNRDG